MVVTAWITLIFFGYFTLVSSSHFYIRKRKLSWFHVLAWFLSAVVTALSAGVIWGGLFQ